MKVKYSYLSVLLSCLFFPVGLLVGSLISLYFKSVNPEARDITQGLAYLGYIVIPALVVMIAGWLGALVTLIQARKAPHDDMTRLALIVFCVVSVLVISLALVNKAENTVVDDYIMSTQQ